MTKKKGIAQETATEIKPETAPIHGTGDIVSELINEQSAPSENAPDDPFPSALADSQGRAFDPALHVAGPDGKPVLTKTGKLSLKRGRKTGAQINTPVRPSEEDIRKKAEARAAGELVAEFIIQTGTGVFGTEWEPRKIDDNFTERDYLKKAWANYFEAKEWTEIPTEIGIVIATGSYMVPRFGMPNTRKKLGSVFVFIRKMFGKLRRKKTV